VVFTIDNTDRDAVDPRDILEWCDRNAIEAMRSTNDRSLPESVLRVTRDRNYSELTAAQSY